MKISNWRKWKRSTMPGKRKSKQRQLALTSLLLPEVKVPASVFGKSICVPDVGHAACSAGFWLLVQMRMCT
eukprot:scaffold18347_cov128-Isochrysis_galbana.AAC.1